MGLQYESAQPGDMSRPTDGIAGQFVEYLDARLFVPQGHFDEELLLGGGMPENHVLGAFRRFVTAGDFIIDVGANIGTHSFALAALSGKNGRIYAVEADIDNIVCLRRSVVRSGTENIVILPVAAGRSPGLLGEKLVSATNVRFGEIDGGGATRTAVCVPLDGLFAERIALIKLDIEGAELLALQGLTNTIARWRPIVISEFSPDYIQGALGADRSDELFRFFADLGYDCYHLDFSGELIHQSDFAALIASYKEQLDRFDWKHIDLLFAPSERPLPEREALTETPAARGHGKVFAAPDFLKREPASPIVPWRYEVPSLAVPVSQLCTFEQMLAPQYDSLCRRLDLDPSSKQRKIWEFAYILSALEFKGKLSPGMRGLGFGAGREPLASCFAATGTVVVVTDAPEELGMGRIWGNSGEWINDVEALWRPTIVSRHDFFDRATFRSVDMNAIPPDLRDFDFCWSACALEHLGSIRKGLDFVQASLETLKPGGVAVHTTEFNLSSAEETFENPLLCLFRRGDIERLIEKLAEDGHTVEPLNLWPGASAVDKHIDLPPWSDLHLKLEIEGFTTTSIGLIVTRR